MRPSLGPVLAAAELIESIVIKGNERSLSLSIENKSGLKIGDEITRAHLQSARSRVSSSGLFDSVEILEVAGSKKDHKIIVIEVKEKVSWFIIPTFQYSRGAISGGLIFAETNLFGRFKKVGIGGDWGNLQRRIFAGYRDPSIFGSRFILSIDGLYRREDVDEYMDRSVVRTIRFAEFGGTFMPGIQWNDSFSTSMGLFYRRIDYQKILPYSQDLRPLHVRDGNDSAIHIEFLYKNIKNNEGLVTGARISLESQLSDNRFFSNYNYFRQLLRFLLGTDFFESRLNWVGQGSAQYASNSEEVGLPFIRELSTGGLNLRGYKSQQFRGDTRYALNQEITYELLRWKKLVARSVAFLDSSIIYFKDDQFSREAWKNGVGVGFRFYMKGITLPLLGYDFAWGIEDSAFAHYLNVGSTF